MTLTPSNRTIARQLTRRGVLRRASFVVIGAAVSPVLGVRDGSAQEATPAACPPAGTPSAGTATVSTPSATPEATGCREHIVEMNHELRFVPDELTIKVGDMVTWTTVGAIPHTSTADPEKANNPEEHVKLPKEAEPWDSGMVNQGESWSRTFDVPGEYIYFCIPHEMAGMVASLTVTE